MLHVGRRLSRANAAFHSVSEAVNAGAVDSGFLFRPFSFGPRGPHSVFANEVLQSATINPAKFRKREQELGTVAEGKLADLMLLDANPLDDTNITKRIAAVVLIGRYLSRTELNTWPDRAAAIARR